MMWIGPRVTVTMGEDVCLYRAFARRSRTGVPNAAILLQCGVASLLLLTQSFEAVLEFVQFGLIACSFLTVLGLIKLRITRPDLPRPCRTWGYPFTPITFLAVTLFMMTYLVVERPLQALAGSLMMLGPRAVRGRCANSTEILMGRLERWNDRTLPGIGPRLRRTSSRYSAVLDCFTTFAKFRAPAMKPSAASSPDSG